jgi:hypothetical protein
VRAKSLDRERKIFNSVIDNVSTVKYKNLDISGIYQLPHTGRKGLEKTAYICKW